MCPRLQTGRLAASSSQDCKVSDTIKTASGSLQFRTDDPASEGESGQSIPGTCTRPACHSSFPQAPGHRDHFSDFCTRYAHVASTSSQSPQSDVSACQNLLHSPRHIQTRDTSCKHQSTIHNQRYGQTRRGTSAVQQIGTPAPVATLHREQGDPPFPRRKKGQGRRHKERRRLHPKGSQQLSATLLSGIVSFSIGPRFDENQRSNGPAVSAALREAGAMQCGEKLSAGPRNGTHHRCVPSLKPAPCLIPLPVLPVCSPGLFSRCPILPDNPSGAQALPPMVPFFRLSRPVPIVLIAPLVQLVQLCRLCPCGGMPGTPGSPGTRPPGLTDENRFLATDRARTGTGPFAKEPPTAPFGKAPSGKIPFGPGPCAHCPMTGGSS